MALVQKQCVMILHSHEHDVPLPQVIEELVVRCEPPQLVEKLRLERRYDNQQDQEVER